MMPPAAKWFATLIALLSLSGCAVPARPQAMPVLEVRGRFETCPRPVRPDLPLLDEGAHMGTLDALQRLMAAVDGLASHARALEAALDCYEQRGTSSDRR